VAVAVALFASVTVTVYVVAALVIVGVPVIAPVEAENESPVGSVGETLYASGVVPPDPVTGVNEVAARFCVRVALAMACVAVTAVFTVKLKFDCAVALFASVTVTVYVVAELVPVGVPVIAPVEVERLSPAGSVGDTP
jgi:hypothetical protein